MMYLREEFWEGVKSGAKKNDYFLSFSEPLSGQRSCYINSLVIFSNIFFIFNFQNAVKITQTLMRIIKKKKKKKKKTKLPLWESKILNRKS